MTTKIKTSESHVKLAAPQLPEGIRSGGETRPLDYPHLYQIQAGDWRISYAVEHNRLAILVLEVLSASGESSKDPVREKLTRKMKVKLLDWPEGTGGPQLPPEEISKKLKIKWLDLAEDGDDGDGAAPHAGSRIKLKNPGENKGASRRKITLLEPIEGEVVDDPEVGGPDGEDPAAIERKVTPLDEPSM